MKTRPFLAALSPALLSAVAFGQYQTIASESFEYAPGPLGGLGSGTGWDNNWWSGGTADDALVTTPGIDAVGEKITTNNSDGGSYRVVSRNGLDSIVNVNDRFGQDDTVMYISFDMQRVGDDQYGGFSLFDQGCCEVLFIGTPWQTDAVGIQDYSSGGAVTTIIGSDPNTLQRVVARFDYMVGPDRLRIWLDPASSHPDTGADLDVMLGDVQWNELRFQSGQPVTMGAGGFHFDNLLIDSDSLELGDRYCMATANSTGSPASISATGSLSVTAQDLTFTAAPVPDQFGLFYFGPNQISLPFGNGFRCVGGSSSRLPLEMGSGNVLTHVVDFTAEPALSQFTATSTWNVQAWFRDPAAGGAAFNLSDALELLFGA